jgi:heme exporter protein C
MTQVLSWNLVAFCILFSALVVLRWRQLRNEDALAELREEVGN